VTGHTDDGKSIFVSDEVMEPVTAELLAGIEFYSVWAGAGTPSVPADSAAPEPAAFFPAFFPVPPGIRCLIFELPPDTVRPRADFDPKSALDEMNAKLPGLAEAMDPDHPGFHTTDTVDIDILLSGRVILELDDGAEVDLGPGECVVQNGTRHVWHNRTTEPAWIASIVIGAHRR
jgi:mannose-6-phosphate isomerase-like protein (cupin superfamily)